MIHPYIIGLHQSQRGQNQQTVQEKAQSHPKARWSAVVPGAILASVPGQAQAGV